MTLSSSTANKSLSCPWLALLVSTAAALGCSVAAAYTFSHHDYMYRNNNVLAIQNPVVELRLDPHGGTGLYANEAIQAGQTLNAMAQTDVVFSADERSVIGTVVDNFCGLPGGETNGFTESCSIGATLASWKLLTDSNKQKQAGIPDKTALHASTLPWEKARWQLPLLWSDQVLEQALQYGQEQAMSMLQAEQQQQQNQCNNNYSYNYNYNNQQQQQQQQQKEEIQQACQAAKRQVLNFRLAAACLAEELGPTLQKQYGIQTTPAEVSLVCHQALGLVFSRSFLHAATGEKCMFPTIDSANHHATPNAETKSDPNNQGGVLLVACRPIQKDEEITITYGLEDANAGISFSGYGFVPHGLAQKSAADKALQLAAMKGQEIAKASLVSLDNLKQQQQHWPQPQQGAAHFGA